MSYGCFYRLPEEGQFPTTQYLPQIGFDVYATLLSTNSRTVITQTFVNPSPTEAIPEVFYSFPLYESASVVSFSCHLGNKVIEGAVKPKRQAEETYREAKSKKRTAAIFDQAMSTADTFTTRLGNVPADGVLLVIITLVQELSQDAQTDGVRYTIPVTIAPRYGTGNGNSDPPQGTLVKTAIKVDIAMGKGCAIRNIRSPSHPIQVDLGRASYMTESAFESCYASVKLRENVVIQEDFVLTVNADGQGLPFAFLETHPTLPNQQALMVSLVPEFSLPPDPSEIVFIIDRSGSMYDKIPTLRSALELFLKSLPLGLPFNIISFGFSYSALWPRSKVADRESLEEALEFTKSIEADMGGTEILGALQAAVESRDKEKFLEALVLTDGQVWDQGQIFDFVNRAYQEDSARFFTLGIGNSVSHSLINGISRAGMGFPQTVFNYEDLNKTVVRMLKGALMPRLENCKLDMIYQPMIYHPEVNLVEAKFSQEFNYELQGKPAAAEPNPLSEQAYKEKGDVDVHEPLASLAVPRVLQAPTNFPPLFPFVRSHIYVLYSQHLMSVPQTITLRADSNHGPLELEVSVQDVGKGQTVHQLAAKKAISELEESRGWVHFAKDSHGELIKKKWGSRLNELVQKECERLGVNFQIAGKHCSFVGVLDDDLSLDSESDLNYDGDSMPAARSKKWRREGICLDVFDSEEEEDMGYAQRRRHQRGSHPANDMNDFIEEDIFSDDEDNERKEENEGAVDVALGLSHNASDCASERSPSPAPANVTPLQRLISLQSFDGYWDWNDELLQTIGLEADSSRCMVQTRYDILKESLGGSGSDFWSNSVWLQILATSLVGCFLEKKASESQDVWDLVKIKADSWLQASVDAICPGDKEVVRKLVEESRSWL